MSLSTKFVIMILAAAILIGAAAKTTISSAGIKPPNFALAQLVLPFQTRVLIQGPLEQQPLATTTPGVSKQITVQDVVNKVDIGGEVYVASAADCPTGTILTGGGYFEKSSSTTDFKIVEDNPGVTPGSRVINQCKYRDIALARSQSLKERLLKYMRCAYLKYFTTRSSQLIFTLS